MDDLRKVAHDVLQRRDPTSISITDSELRTIPVPGGLDTLWEHISLQGNASNMETCENLLIARDFLKLREPKSLSYSEKDVLNHIYEWATSMALPSAAFATMLDDTSEERRQLMRDEQLRSNLALSVISLLAGLVPVQDADNPSHIILALASFTSEDDPWTTPESHATAIELLSTLRLDSSFWSSIEKILKETIRPLFAKTRNPAITAAGRKNLHPVPLARFDTSILDPESKPWKVSDVYATTTLSWIVKQYRHEDKTHLEAHVPLLVPPVLALIDDDSTAFKTRGCRVLIDLLSPIKESKSDILQRTNLSSVFEDAIRPCLLSLPTITPEDEAISLLGAAYPALLSLLKINFLNSPQKFSPSTNEANEVYVSSLAKTLRDDLISSFHHISSTSTTSASPIASFPYPRLSTLLLEHVTAVIFELGIHTTKYLQDIIPLIHTTLSNPFGPAYPPLLFASMAVARAVILNAHPRLWRWRGEMIGALCSCFLHAVDEEHEISHREERGGLTESDENTRRAMDRLKQELKGSVYLLKLALENPLQPDGDVGQLEAKDSIAKELEELVAADDTLRDLLIGDVDKSKGELFGLHSGY